MYIFIAVVAETEWRSPGEVEDTERSRVSSGSTGLLETSTRSLPDSPVSGDETRVPQRTRSHTVSTVQGMCALLVVPRVSR